MKKILFLTAMVFTFIGNANSQKSKLIGSWLMTKVEVSGEVESPYFITDFKENGKMVVMDMEVGTWKYNKGANAIEMKSKFDKDFNGVSNILKLDVQELIVTKGDAKLYYQKVDENKVADQNEKSRLVGSWKISDSNVSKYIKFELPNSYTIVERDDASTTTLRGVWIFDPNDNTLIFVGLSSMLRGRNTLNYISSEKVEFKKNGNIITAIKETSKEVSKSNSIERLSFTEDEYFTEDGDFKHESDIDKLPWQNGDDLLMSLVNVKQLVYTFSSLVEEVGVFEDKTLTADVNSNPAEQALSIDYIFYGYDRYNLPDDTKLPPNNDYDALLYPEKENTFRVVGTEKILTAAGTFDCVVIEVMADFEARKKLWAIKDKPGIYAKIIEDKPGMFGHYFIYELKEIK